ncbi:hypothetical protein ACPRNU_25520 [Chromobacterium vaccinii]|uniref:hypothetical protein n=1 Tax=Chromobacterium vaccinii TaxID=1108595 RepID=UPI003C73B4BD
MTIIAIVTREAGHDAGYYERLREAHANLRARNSALESLVRDKDRALEFNYQQRQGLEIEVRMLRQQLAEQGQQIIDLRVEAEQAEQLQQQLEARDREVEELRHALAVARLSPESRNNVIQLIRETAA